MVVAPPVGASAPHCSLAMAMMGTQHQIADIAAAMSAESLHSQ